MEKELLSIENLQLHIDTPRGRVQAVRGVSLSLHEGELLALVGESGCGKSMLCRAVMGLLPPAACITRGCIRLCGKELTALTEKELCTVRGREASMMLQDPMTALNPTLTIGRQIAEAVHLHAPKLRRREVRAQVLAQMAQVGLPAERVYDAYPCQLSGGMRQRSVLAIALAAQPKLLLADEPTTALDVTMQAQILDLLASFRQTHGMAVLLVSHDLGVVAQYADRVAVMYAGRIVEIGTAEEIFYDARHPYTRALLRSLPARSRGGALETIPGMPPTLIDPPPGDAFACRNAQALAIDYLEEPPMFQVTQTHFAATWLLDPRAQQGGNDHE